MSAPGELDDRWQSVADAAAYIASGKAERLDGAGFKVYRAGTIIRVDLAADFHNPTPLRSSLGMSPLG